MIFNRQDARNAKDKIIQKSLLLAALASWRSISF